jgi:glycosyltransferase involved in cell wall biosynthesis
MKFRNTTLIIGPLPPPIGGVSVHVQRLIGEFNRLNYIFSFINLKNFKIFIFLKFLITHRTIHLHSSNIYFQLIISFFAFITRKKLIVTFHRDLFRYGFIHRKIVLLIVLLCDIPIVLNVKSYNFTLKYNTKTKLMSAFIPPDFDSEISLTSIPDFSHSIFEKKFCTNAFNVAIDKNGQEIYQITTLIDIFLNFPAYLLVISDPSGSYKDVLNKSHINLPPNIIIISYPHSFFQILKQTDCLIRYTTTDGDSLSVREALYLNKSVIATNIVDRPNGVTTVNFNKADLINLIENIDLSLSLKNNTTIPNTTMELISLYN